MGNERDPFLFLKPVDEIAQLSGLALCLHLYYMILIMSVALDVEIVTILPWNKMGFSSLAWVCVALCQDFIIC